MAKGKRFDSMQDVYNQAILERYALIHYLKALEKFLYRSNPYIFFHNITFATDNKKGEFVQNG